MACHKHGLKQKERVPPGLHCTLDMFRNIFLLLLTTYEIRAFNILTSESNFIRNPEAPLPGGGKSGPDFFGYDFALKLMKNGRTRNASLVVGAPKGGISLDDWSSPIEGSTSTEDPNLSKPGDVFSCAFSFSQSAPPCRSISPVDYPDDPDLVIDGDAMGLSIVKPYPESPTAPLTVCAPLRARNCTSDFLTQGACYSSNDFGKVWASDTRQATVHCPVQLIDLIFVLDGSGSVTATDPENFDVVKKWVKGVAAKFDIKEYAHVGVIQYSHWYKRRTEQPYLQTEIRLGEFQDQAEFEEAVDKIDIQGYTTYTAHAINKTVEDFKQSERFNDSSTKKVMILLTDGLSNDADMLPVSADYARASGITSFAVGVAEFSKKELQIIATGEVGNSERVYGLQKFSDLQKIVGSLQKSISGILEGGVSRNETNELQTAETGIGGATSKDGRLYLGAVGAYDWSGTVTKYDSVDDTDPDIPSYKEVQKVLPNFTKESYMGYSVTTGYFENAETEYVATGAPRYALKGAVVIYEPKDRDAKFNNYVRLMGHPSRRKLGAYFGGSVLAVDVNGDNKDDLFVGAPLFVDDRYDEGRVFVYVSMKESGTLGAWENESYMPLELAGDNSVGGRFGTAMASAGDLNKDGYNDVIIGAPLVETDRGAVFVYHGNENGVSTTFKQKILASEMTGVTLKYFGQSLQGGVDLDGNKYPDIAVGAPKSDTVVIFRSRPVVNIQSEMNYRTDDIDIFKCIDQGYTNCTVIEVCFTASGTSVENEVGLKFNVTMDTGKAGSEKRLGFRDDNDAGASPKATWPREITLQRNTQLCFRRGVHMKSNIKDYDSPIVAEVEYDLLESHTSRPLSSIRDPSIPNKDQDTLRFVKSCGNDGCDYDLRVVASLSLPSYKAANGKDLTENGTVLVVDQATATTPVTVQVNLSNHGENAFDTQLDIVYTSLISLSTLATKAAFPPSDSCVVESSEPQDLTDGMRKLTFRYNYKTNIMRQNAWCYFEFNLITENLRNNGSLDKFVVKVEARTSDSSQSSSEINEDDNVWTESPKISYRSDFSLKKAGDSQIAFNYTENEANITSISEIGLGTSNIVTDISVNGNGYSKIPLLDVALRFPLKTASGDMLLYLYRVECTPKDANTRASCTCDQDVVNTYNLSLDAPDENSTNGNFVTITPTEVGIEAPTFDCYSNGNKNITCGMLKCGISDLSDSDQINLKAYFRLWTSSIIFNGTDFSEIELRSRFEVDSKDSLYVVDRNGMASIVRSEEVITTAKQYQPPDTPEPVKDLLWVYILAALGGLLLLIILVIVLWKVGFFKSKYADMKKDAEEMEDGSDFQGNGDGSQDGIVE